MTQASDAARGDPEVKAAYGRVMEALIGVLEGSLGPQAKAGEAMAALCVGGLTLARATEDPARSREILRASRDLALKLVSETKAPALVQG